MSASVDALITRVEFGAAQTEAEATEARADRTDIADGSAGP